MADQTLQPILDQVLPDDWPDRADSRLISAGELRWHVQVSGAGRCIVMLHGAGSSAHSFSGLLPFLKDRFELVRIDLPGHGFTSAYASGAYTLQRAAGSVAELLSAMALSPHALIGHSAGAAIGLQLFVNRKLDPRTTRVLALNPALLPFDGLAGIVFPVFARLAANSGLLSALLAHRARDRRQLARVIEGTGSRLDRTELEWYWRLMQRPQHVGAVLAMMAGWRLDELLPAIRRADLDLHVLLADNDRAVPPDSTVSALAGICDDLQRLPRLGHLMHEEAPQQVADWLIDRLTGPRKGALDG